MVRKLQKKFILIVALVLFLVLGGLVGAVNGINYWQTEQKTDVLLNMLLDNEHFRKTARGTRENRSIRRKTERREQISCSFRKTGSPSGTISSFLQRLRLRHVTSLHPQPMEERPGQPTYPTSPQLQSARQKCMPQKQQRKGKRKEKQVYSGIGCGRQRKNC